MAIFLLKDNLVIQKYDNEHSYQTPTYFHVHPYENENINFDNIEKVAVSWKDTLFYIIGTILSLISIIYIIIDLIKLRNQQLVT
jgi:hypothetical protein